MPEGLYLDETKRAQLDNNIKEMLANGATPQDVEKMASEFTAKFSVKKKRTNYGITFKGWFFGFRKT